MESTRLLVICACVVALVGKGDAGCFYDRWGNITRFAFKDRPLRIKPTEVDAILDLPYMYNLGCKVVGAFASICDKGEHGYLHFIGDLTIRVHRPPNNRTGYVYSTVYCKPVVPETDALLLDYN